MAAQRSLLSQALSSNATSPQVSQPTTPLPRRMYYGRISCTCHKAGSHPTNFYVHSTSSPIATPNALEIAPNEIRLRDCWRPAPPRIHHKDDDVTHYHRTGTRGWEQFHEQRLKNGEKQTGRVLKKWFKPTSAWEKREMERKGLGACLDEAKSDDKKGEEKAEAAADGEEKPKSEIVWDEQYDCWAMEYSYW